MDKYQETFDTWNKIAKIYEDKFMNLDLYNDTYDAFVDLLPKANASILEIGCGPGIIPKYLLTKNPSLKITGIDISENMLALAKKNNPSTDFEIMNTRKINNINDSFDAIMCGFCIPYLSKTDCLKFINDCKNLLNNSGILYLSFVEGNYENSGFITGSSGDRTYFYYHNLEQLQKELKANTFETKGFFKKSYEKSDGTKENHTILIVKKP